ncbi:hypothetical protein FPV67DRAFT_1502934 [Lyophyllum atratum]|nr:hypothetical protein FPV67DRAFT_1502934 [Lyophyllum atratum]
MTFINVPRAVMTSPSPCVTKFVGFTSTADGVLHLPRAGSDSASTTLTTSASSSVAVTTTRPFFQDPSSVTPSPSPTSNGEEPEGNALAKAVLEYAILAVGLVIVGCVILRRCVRLRRNNEPLSRFFSFTPRPVYSSSTSSLHPFVQTHRFPRTTGLSEVPPYPYAQRTRAHDTDAAGRRIGGLQNSDHDGYIGDKDVLPAYDNSGGPPKYGELDMMPTRSSFAVDAPGTDRGTGIGIVPQSVVGGDPGVRRHSRSESRSHEYPPAGRPSDNPDVERGDAIAAPAAVHVREYFAT